MHQQIHLNDAEEISAFLYAATGMIPGYTQYSRGSAALRYHALDLDGVSLLWAQGQAHCRWQDQMSDDGRVHFGFVLQAEKGVRSLGKELTAQDAMLFLPGQEMDYIFLGPVHTLEIAVSRELVTQMGWTFSGRPLAHVPGTSLNDLSAVCRRVMQFAISTKTEPTQPMVQVARDQVLTALEAVLFPWLPTKEDTTSLMIEANKNHEILLLADRYIADDHNGKADVSQLAKQCGVSPRTLFYAFRQSLGITPRKYSEILRLAELKKRLEATDPTKSTVTQHATELGFWDLGRLAGRYHKQFGEHPSHTLKN